MPENGNIFEFIGTPAYLAPEIISENGYSGFKADIWSLGITCFIALTGHIPFKGDSFDQLKNKIMREKIEFPKDCILSNEMKDVITKMLEKNPQKRIPIDQIAQSLNINMERVSETKHLNLNNVKTEIIQSFGIEKSDVFKNCIFLILTELDVLFPLCQ